MKAGSALVMLALALSGRAAAAPLPEPAKAPAKIVVQTSEQLRNALRAVPDGGVVELRAGVYPSPAGGFSIANPRQGFTVQAAPGAVVFLDGGGQRPVLRFKNGDRSRGRKVTFRGLTFRNGRALPGTADAGGVTVQAAEAAFAACAFTGNVTAGTAVGGGALRLSAGALVTLTGTRFDGNASTRRGGAIEAAGSTLEMTGGRFLGNRSNLPGHNANASGGAVYLQDSAARFTNVFFAGNEAAWVGGALYAIGTWSEPAAVPRTTVRLERTSFFGNRVLPAPGQVALSAGQGGALHAEDQAAVAVVTSAFAGNAAEVGAAINVYRAALEVTGSIFADHRAGADGSGFGGTIAALSADVAEAAGGGPNRPNARVVVRDSLLQGPSGPSPAALAGGCLMAGGDGARVSGEASVPALGGLDENRAGVVLERTVLAGCAAASRGATPGAGGAVRADLVELQMRDSLVLGSSARGAGGAGGGLSLVGGTRATLAGVTFAGNAADHSGGAVQVRGATLDGDDLRFFANSVAAGHGAVGDSRGAALYSIPSPRDPAAGTVRRSLFAGQAGVAVRDVDLASGPVNDLRYDANRFYLRPGDPYGDTVYVHTPEAPAGLDAGRLNDLVLFRPGRGTTDKSAEPNVREHTPPSAGALLAIQAAGAAAARLGPYLAFAWTGPAATLDGAPLPTAYGLIPSPAPGAHRLALSGGESVEVVVDP